MAEPDQEPRRSWGTTQARALAGDSATRGRLAVSARGDGHVTVTIAEGVKDTVELFGGDELLEGGLEAA